MLTKIIRYLAVAVTLGLLASPVLSQAGRLPIPEVTPPTSPPLRCDHYSNSSIRKRCEDLSRMIDILEHQMMLLWLDIQAEELKSRLQQKLQSK